jgi:hypothetical protein
MGFALVMQSVLSVTSTVLNSLVARLNEPKSSSLGDVTAPTAEEGRAIPVAFGTVLLKGLNVCWYGDLKATAIKQKQSWWQLLIDGVTGGLIGLGEGFLSNALSPAYAYRYHLGFHAVLCHGPIDALVALGYVANQSGVHVGDGQVTGISIPPNAHQQTWTLTCRVDTTKFTVVGSVDGAGSDATVGVGYYHSQVGFMIVAGPTIPFQTGDTFVFDTVLPAAIFAQSKALVYTTVTHDNLDSTENFIEIDVNCENLFGGDKSGGGMVGYMAFYRGLQTQQPDPYLCKKLPGVNGVGPAYLGICHAVAYQMYVGTQPVIQDMSFAVQRCPDPLSTGDGNILGDANPAWIIYDLMSNAVYGLAEPTARFDPVSFKAAAATLFSEQMGMSMSVDTAGGAESIIADVLRHIDAVLFTDPATGLWTLTLNRFDYDPATLPVLDESNILIPPELSRVSWEETLNDIKVTYIDRSMFFTPRVVQAHESANHAVRGMIGSMSFDFKGFSNGSIAQQVTSREMKARSYPLLKGKIVANRVAWAFRMGGVFILNWPPLGIENLVLRIGAINYGALENGQIEIDVVEDIFALQVGGYSPPPFPGWTDPAQPPQPPIDQNLMEFPYFITGPRCARVVMTMAARGDQISLVYSVELAGTVTESNQPFTPYGELLSAYPAKTAMDDSTGFVLAASPSVDIDTLTDCLSAERLTGLNLFVVDDEIMAFRTVVINSDGTANIAGVLRGLHDTVPADHAAGAKVWFFGDNAGQTNTAGFPTDEMVSVKCLPINNYGAVKDTAVAAVTLTTDSRAQLPYPPGNVLVNGVSYPDDILGDAVMTWADRNRTAQGQNAIPQTQASVPGGIEGNYTIEVLINGVVIHTHTGVTGNTFTYLLADRLTDNPDGGLPTSIRITPVNGTLVGQARTVTFLMTGFGVMFGLEFGGLQL